MTEFPLAALFLDALPRKAKGPQDLEALEATLRGLLEAARQGAPTLPDEAGFLRHVAAHLRGEDPSLAVSELQAADLGLAWVCAR